jgi:ABC-type dipeptide/oligopeptide/nickel transport system permease subunit
MRGIDAFMALPDILLVLILVPLFSSSLSQSATTDLLEPFNDLTRGAAGVTIAIAATSWMLPARLVRAQVLTLRELDFTRAALVGGVSRTGLILRHLLPNLSGLVITAFVLGMPRAILAESAIAYLGFGVTPPTPSLGGLIADGVKVMRAHPMGVLVPSVQLAVIVICINLLTARRRAFPTRSKDAE